MAVWQLKDVPEDNLVRFSSTFDELDWTYGRRSSWGMGRGKTSVWKAPPGTGKTRLAAQMMMGMSGFGLTSMIFQGEVSAGQFRSEKMPGFVSDCVYISNDTDIFAQLAAIEKYAPDLVFTDSVQQIEQFNNGRGAKQIVRQTREIISRTGTHVVFISQVTTTNSAKGGTELPHEVDTECLLRRWAPETAPAFFSLVVEKNRYGCSGGEAVFGHTDTGVVSVSRNRIQDTAWLDDHPQDRPLTRPLGRKRFLGLF